MEKIDSNDLKNVLNLEIFDGETPSTPDDFENSPLINDNIIPDSLVNEEVRPTNPIIEQRNDLKLGLTPENIKDLYLYVSGIGDKPEFVDKYLSDVEGRTRDMIAAVNLYQLSTLPIKIAYHESVLERLFTPESLYSMDMKDLTSASASLSKDINGVLNSATNSLVAFNTTGTLNSTYRDMLGKLMLLPPEKINTLADMLSDENYVEGK